MLTDKELDDYDQKVYLHDTEGKRQIGTSGVAGYKIEKTYLQNAQTNIYKIRIEAGVPVIYAKYAVAAGKFKTYESIDTADAFFAAGVKTKARYNGDEKVESARFSAGSAIIEFVCEENYIWSQVFSNKSASSKYTPVTDIASLSDCPYYFPSYDKNSNLCSRKTVCDIINEYGLQWFFPMYVTEENGVVRILGDGIVTGKRVYALEHIYSSTMSRLIGTEYENNVYTSYYDPSETGGELSAIGLCYLPETCDTPYFNRSYFNSDHVMMVVTVKNGKIGQYFKVDDPVPSSAEPIVSSDYMSELYMGKPVDFSTLEPIFTTDYPYVKDSYDTYYPTRPFDIKYLPLLVDDQIDTPKLFTGLGVSVPQFEHVNGDLSALKLGHREINVVDMEEVVINYEEQYGGEGADFKEYKVKANEEINGYIIDMSGCVCGRSGQAGFYLFTTVTPCFDLTVKALNGEAVYMSYDGDPAAVCADNMILGVETKAGDGSDITSCGIRVDTLLHILYRIGVEGPVIDIVDDGFDNQFKSYVIRADVMNLPYNVCGIRSGDSRVYTYYSNAVKVVEKGRVYWLCPSDDYEHGYFREVVLYDGEELKWYYTESDYEYDE